MSLSLLQSWRKVATNDVIGDDVANGDAVEHRQRRYLYRYALFSVKQDKTVQW
jgi:hypothetical protein